MNFSETDSVNFWGGLSVFFYLVDPKTALYKDWQSVPNYWQQAYPFFAGFILLEYVTLWARGNDKHIPRFNDTWTSVSLGLLYECGKILFRGAEASLYFWVYEKYRLLDLPWDSALTWYLAALAVDFGYYWVHRAAHEINVLWAQHQVHHSSEDFNLAVGLRHGFFQAWISWLLYTPLALVIPPAQFMAHQQFNLLYQFWIHTELINSLGPLEWVFNTPRHHRLHHGCNREALDKNYGGVLILWDRLFGTFKDDLDEPIVYGLVHKCESFNPVTLQTFYCRDLWRRLKTLPGFSDKFSALVKGPSWTPGSPWTGWSHLKLEIKERPKYDVEVSNWTKVYLSLHFILIIVQLQELSLRLHEVSQWSVLLIVCYFIVSLTNFGLLMENNSTAKAFESARCAVLVYCMSVQLIPADGSWVHFALEMYLAMAAVFWGGQFLEKLTSKSKLMKNN